MSPYVPVLMPELQKALVDPLPEVRATAARAMGSLLRGLGPDAFPSLLPWLLEALRSEGSSVERSGAAQGLAEVVAVLGAQQLEALLPELVAGASARNAYVREGHLTLFRYLPLTMEAPFMDHLALVLPTLLNGLSDEVEGVRDAALAAGRTVVDTYARSCLPLLLPTVEAGLEAGAWRIRQASVELCGELLFKVAGTSGKVKLDGDSDDEGAAQESYGAAIASVLGPARYAEMLSVLYVARSDVQYTVRNAALHVWKSVVANTPRTLQEILPALMDHLVASLAAEVEDRRAAAARCLGELVRKMGERVLGRMVPILRDGLTDEASTPSTRQGVCAGLREVLENMTRPQLMEHLADVLPPVQRALCDGDPAVREAAGATFGVLFRGGAGSAVDTVVPTLLEGLDASGGQALEGLRVILAVRPQIFNGVAPKLLRPPPSVAKLTALGVLAEVAASVLPSHLAAILATTLALASTHPKDSPLGEAAQQAALQAALAVGEEGAGAVVGELLHALEEASRRLGGARLAAGYARSVRGAALEDHLDDLLGPLLLLLVQESEELVLAGWAALDAWAGALPREAAAAHVSALREAVAGAREAERRKRRGGPLEIAGFCVPPKALAPVLPIFLQGVLQGATPEVREEAAEGLGDLVALTSEGALRPFVVPIAGPLIRIMGDRLPGSMRAAILATLGLLGDKAGAALKAFVPQLQTTFLKCLNDPTPSVRLAAATNLGRLARLSARADQLVGDLAAGAASASDAGVAAASLAALRVGLDATGERLSPATLERVWGALGEVLEDGGAVAGDDAVRCALALALSALAARAPPQRVAELLAAAPLGPRAQGALAERETAAMVLAAAAGAAGGRLEEAGVLGECIAAAARFAKDPEASVKVAGGRAMARLFLAEPRAAGAPLVAAATALLGPDQGSETQRQALLALRRVAEAPGGAAQLASLLPALLPSVCAILASGPSGVLKSAAEQLLKHALGLAPEAGGGLEAAQAAAQAAGGSAKAFLTDAYLRRLQKVGEDEWAEREEY